MRRDLAVIAVGLTVSAALGCGSDERERPTGGASTPRALTAGAVNQARMLPSTGRLGATLRYSDGTALATMRLMRYEQDVAASLRPVRGHRWDRALIRLVGVRGETFPSLGVFLAVDKRPGPPAGGVALFQPNLAGASTRNDDITLRPGQSRTGWVTFAPPARARIGEVRVTDDLIMQGGDVSLPRWLIAR